jgi:hypothetical protein
MIARTPKNPAARAMVRKVMNPTVSRDPTASGVPSVTNIDADLAKTYIRNICKNK